MNLSSGSADAAAPVAPSPHASFDSSHPHPPGTGNGKQMSADVAVHMASVKQQQPPTASPQREPPHQNGAPAAAQRNGSSAATSGGADATETASPMSVSAQQDQAPVSHASQSSLPTHDSLASLAVEDNNNNSNSSGNNDDTSRATPIDPASAPAAASAAASPPPPTAPAPAPSAAAGVKRSASPTSTRPGSPSLARKRQKAGTPSDADDDGAGPATVAAADAAPDAKPGASSSPPQQQQQLQHVKQEGAEKQEEDKDAGKATAHDTKEHLMGHVATFCEVNEMAALSMVSRTCRDVVSALPEWRQRALCLVQDLRGHIGGINVLIQVHNFVFSGSSDGKIKIWNPRSWTCERTVNVSPLPQPGNAYQQQHHHPHDPSGAGGLKRGRKAGGAASASAAGMRGGGYSSAAAADGGTDEPGEQTNAVTALAVLDKVLFIGLADGYLIIRMIMESRDSRADNRRIPAHTGALTAIAVLRAGRDHPGARVFTGGRDAMVKVWDATTYTPLVKLRMHTEMVTALEVCCGRLFSGGRDGQLNVWSAADPHTHVKLLAPPPLRHQLGADRAFGCITALASLADRVYTASWDCYVRVWDAERLVMLHEVFNTTVGITWSLAVRAPAGQPPSLVCGVRDGEVEVRRIGDGHDNLECVSSSVANRWCSELDRHDDWVLCVLPLPDGRIVTGSEDWSLKVWGPRFAPAPEPAAPRASPNGPGPDTDTRTAAATAAAAAPASASAAAAGAPTGVAAASTAAASGNNNNASSNGSPAAAVAQRSQMTAAQQHHLLRQERLRAQQSAARPAAAPGPATGYPAAAAAPSQPYGASAHAPGPSVSPPPPPPPPRGDAKPGNAFPGGHQQHPHAYGGQGGYYAGQQPSQQGHAYSSAQGQQQQQQHAHMYAQQPPPPPGASHPQPQQQQQQQQQYSFGYGQPPPPPPPGPSDP